MPSPKTLVAIGLFIACAAMAQTAPADDPDWKEVDAPPPAMPDLRRLVPFDVRRDAALSYGVDPASITIGSDAIVRYVVVAHGNGVVNAMYEGLRCGTAEVRTYARYNDGRWTPVRDGDWRSLHDGLRSRHALLFARQGGCNGRAAQRSAELIVRNLRGENYEFQR